MLTSSEKYELNKKFRILQSQICNKANLVDGKIPVEELPILQEIIDALNAANTPSGDNPFATMDDLGALDVGTYITVVANYSALPAANLHTGEFYWLENSEGTAWLPGTLGGTFYNKGLYYSNGTTWVATEAPYQATQAEVNTGLVNDRFVTPYTFENASKWTTKQDVLTNPVTGTGTSGQVSYWTGTGTQGGSANLFWDAVNSRLGVGTSSPTINLQVETNANTSAGIYTRNTNSGSSAYSFISAANNSSASLDIRSHSSSHSAWPNWGMLSTSSGLTGGLVLFASGNAPMAFWTNTVERMRIFGGGNISIGTSSDLSARLGIRGSGTTSSTTALLVQNSTPSDILQVRDDGAVFIGAVAIAQRPYLAGYTNLTEFGGAQRTLGIVTQFIAGNRPDPAILIKNSANLDFTSGTGNFLSLITNYSPTSGTGALNNYVIQPTINQTGGANGITRGLYVNPTLTSAADWRSLEWSNNTGWGLYGAGTANNYLGGSLGIGTASLTAHKIRIAGTVSGATSAFGVQNAITFLSDVTTTGHGYSTGLGTQATAFNMNFMYHYRAQLSGIGAGSTIGTQVGFVADGTIVGATNNYGFQGSIAADTGRWNLYMSGTAANYLAGDTAIGTTTTSGGRLTVRGSGTTSSTTALLVQNGTPSELFKVTDDGTIHFGNVLANAGTLGFNSNLAAIPGNYIGIQNNNVNITTTSGITNHIIARSTYAPTSGTGVFNNLAIQYTINQTGGANGITRGLYVNPTLTAAADWRGVEINTPSKSTIYAGRNTGSAALQVDSTVQGFLPPRVTTAERDLIATPATGLVIFNTTTTKLECYDGAVWQAAW